MAALSPEALATLDRFTCEVLAGGAAVGKGGGNFYQCIWNTWHELLDAGLVILLDRRRNVYFALTPAGIAYKRLTDPFWRHAIERRLGHGS